MSYKEFIDNILNTRGRFACGDEYKERHHIIPRCMGGTNDEDNLIDLYAREHFEAHRLLALENPNKKGLVFAWFAMANLKDKKQKRVKVSAIEYEEARKSYSKMCKKIYSGKNNPNYGRKHTEEERKLMSNNHGRYFGKSNHFYGKKHTEETRKKMKTNNTKKKKVICIENGLIFDSLQEASDYIGIAKQSISKCCNGKQKTCGGYHWCFLNEYNPETYIINFSNTNNNTKRVICIETQYIYNSINEANKKTGIYPSCIGKVCNGKQKTAGGYHWEFV